MIKKVKRIMENIFLLVLFANKLQNANKLAVAQE
jgi:hypothetical protein